MTLGEGVQDFLLDLKGNRIFYLINFGCVNKIRGKIRANPITVSVFIPNKAVVMENMGRL